MLTLPDGLVSNRKVIMIRNSNVYRVNLIPFLPLKFAPVSIGPCIGQGFRGFLKIVCINIADSYNLNIRMLSELIEVGPSHPSDTYAGVV